MKVLLVVNPQKSASGQLAAEIKTSLEKQQIEVVSTSYTDKGLAQHDFDIALSLGGDGTVLFAARSVAAYDVAILPLNLGTVGFIASVHPGQWQEVFDMWINKKAEVSNRIMLDIKVERAGKTVCSLAALNDAVISASGIAKTIRLTAVSNNMQLGAYRSDGLIAATPTGSTAYCASAGGPILDPEMEAIILNPICPFTLFYRPLVLPANERVTVRVEPEQRSGILLTIDGQVTEALDSGDLVHISKTAYKAHLLASERESFYNALHTKLSMLSTSQGGGGM
ncbi:MAG: NAD(+)/NADH kinase [Termitinemataceae bacterium]|nr:MAG: NAD(+)/NADH kinase [Termitinemataceae bacterium]